MKIKRIVCSNLMMRFYLQEWTKEDLEKYLLNGEVMIAHPEDEYPYYVLNFRINSRLDIDKMLADGVKVVRMLDLVGTETDKEFLSHFVA